MANVVWKDSDVVDVKEVCGVVGVSERVLWGVSKTIGQGAEVGGFVKMQLVSEKDGMEVCAWSGGAANAVAAWVAGMREFWAGSKPVWMGVRVWDSGQAVIEFLKKQGAMEWDKVKEGVGEVMAEVGYEPLSEREWEVLKGTLGLVWWAAKGSKPTKWMVEGWGGF